MIIYINIFFYSIFPMKPFRNHCSEEAFRTDKVINRGRVKPKDNFVGLVCNFLLCVVCWLVGRPVCHNSLLILRLLFCFVSEIGTGLRNGEFGRGKNESLSSLLFFLRLVSRSNVNSFTPLSTLRLKCVKNLSREKSKGTHCQDENIKIQDFLLSQ